MNKTRKLLLVTVMLLTVSTVVFAQWQRQRQSRQFSHRAGVPKWQLNEKLPDDVFTFVRVEYSSFGGRGWGGGWRTDYPDADLNFSYRLQEMTSMKVHPDGKTLRLTDPELANYPFIYIIEPGNLFFSELEVLALREYLLNGGFLMVDDFWGEYEWQNFAQQMKRVFPNREPVELDLTHEIFDIVFPIKEKPQIPNVRTGTESEWTGITWEQPDAKTPHYKGLFDDNERLMAIICHNTDLGDGWEREGENEYYFREFSEKSAYPLGINIVFYALTH